MPEKSSNAEAASRIERLRHHQEVLTDFSRTASEARQPAPLLHLACIEAARGIDIGHAKVMRYRPSRDDLLIEAGVGWKPGVVGQAALEADPASGPGRALRLRRPVRIDDLPHDPEYRYPALLDEHGIISALSVPVAMEGAAWGVLEVGSGSPRHFCDDDAVFLSGMANILGLALQGMLPEKRVADIAAQAVRDAEWQNTLMRELLHRDKNDFQMVVSILLMQMDKHQDPHVVGGFKGVIDQVLAISMAHDQLAMRPSQPTIDVAAYLQALCESLGHRSEGIGIATRLASAELSHERAVSLGLIANELVTNAVKYAFPGGKGTVRVEFTVDRSIGQGCLTVADDGVGMGAPRAGAAGLELVKELARYIGGSVEAVAVERGTMHRICFTAWPAESPPCLAGSSGG